MKFETQLVEKVLEFARQRQRRGAVYGFDGEFTVDDILTELELDREEISILLQQLTKEHRLTKVDIPDTYMYRRNGKVEVSRDLKKLMEEARSKVSEVEDVIQKSKKEIEYLEETIRTYTGIAKEWKTKISEYEAELKSRTDFFVVEIPKSKSS